MALQKGLCQAACAFLAIRGCQDNFGPQDLSQLQLHMPEAELGTLQGLRSIGVATLCPCCPIYLVPLMQGDADAARGAARIGQTCLGDALPCHPAPDCCVQGDMPASSELPHLARTSHRCQVSANMCPTASHSEHTCGMAACPAVPGHDASTPLWR